MFIFFKRNDNCIFLGIIPSFKLMVFSCRQTIYFQQHLNELHSVNHHSALSIGQQPVWNLKGHGINLIIGNHVDDSVSGCISMPNRLI